MDIRITDWIKYFHFRFASSRKCKLNIRATCKWAPNNSTIVKYILFKVFRMEFDNKMKMLNINEDCVLTDGTVLWPLRRQRPATDSLSSGRSSVFRSGGYDASQCVLLKQIAHNLCAFLIIRAWFAYGFNRADPVIEQQLIFRGKSITHLPKIRQQGGS